VAGTLFRTSAATTHAPRVLPEQWPGTQRRRLRCLLGILTNGKVTGDKVATRDLLAEFPYLGRRTTC